MTGAAGTGQSEGLVVFSEWERERGDMISIFIIQCRYQDGPGQCWSGGSENKVVAGGGISDSISHSLSILSQLLAQSSQPHIRLFPLGTRHQEICFIYEGKMRLI